MKFFRLGEVCEKIGSGVTPLGGDGVTAADGVALITCRNVRNSGFSPAGLAFLDDEHAARLAHAEVRAGDVLLNVAGATLAQVCQAPFETIPARVDHQVAVIRPRTNILDAGYLRCYLAGPRMQQDLSALSAMAGHRKTLTGGVIAAIHIPAMPLARQRTIGRLFNAIDEKISVTKNIIATLDDMARTLFLSWFVEFDPVRRNIARKRGEPVVYRADKPLVGNLSDEASAKMDLLFPDSFEHASSGRVPKGWCPTTIRELASKVHFGVTPDAAMVQSGTCVVHAAELSDGGIYCPSLARCQIIPA